MGLQIGIFLRILPNQFDTGGVHNNQQGRYFKFDRRDQGGVIGRIGREAVIVMRLKSARGCSIKVEEVILENEKSLVCSATTTVIMYSITNAHRDSNGKILL